MTKLIAMYRCDNNGIPTTLCLLAEVEFNCNPLECEKNTDSTRLFDKEDFNDDQIIVSKSLLKNVGVNIENDSCFTHSDRFCFGEEEYLLTYV